MRGVVSRRCALGTLGGLAATVFAPGTGHAGPRFPTLREGTPEQVGLDPVALGELDEVIAAGLGPGPESTFPGAVLLVARNGVLVKHAAYGHAQTHRDGAPLRKPVEMRPDTVFDLASCTKVLATTAAMMTLVDDGRVRLDDPLARWLPGFPGGVTVRRLLTHTAGLWEWQPTYLWATRPSAAIHYVSGLPLRYEIGAGRHYSDLGFMLLGELVRRCTGLRLDEYVRVRIHRPLRMMSTGYRPPGRHRFAATSNGNPFERNMIATGEPYPILGERGVDDFRRWREHTLSGEVNDGNAAYAFHGVAGHAGLFGTARDIAVFAQSLLNGGGYGTRRLFSAEIIAEFTRDQFEPGQGLGFWTHRFRGVPGLGGGGFGHAGFTGTEFAADPDTGLLVVLLTNRQHPDQPYAGLGPTWLAVREALGRAARG
ncbi:serine hydrolase [Amycolatopsis cihanbeyliensis]|uniref:CubicO group peptidase (Beta-lactamase class C family) n=1 Tax=Amycolatopsis cihanbeyliensis TaxID=1128664 RepID=A0A542DMA6_AMYCI|nr:serine hydrolase [Amycolatopsis cihanbeyliensis]TQJ04115.1 CubicO group peptidase (beta-lactamase class C family) [Amycolatopsis cihanbeyliensis]